MGPSDDPVQGLIQSQHQVLSVLGDKVGEPFCLKQQPQPLDGVEVRWVRRQIDRLEGPLGQCLGLVPTGIIHDQ